MPLALIDQTRTKWFDIIVNNFWSFVQYANDFSQVWTRRTLCSGHMSTSIFQLINYRWINTKKWKNVLENYRPWRTRETRWPWCRWRSDEDRTFKRRADEKKQFKCRTAEILGLAILVCMSGFGHVET